RPTVRFHGSRCCPGPGQRRPTSASGGPRRPVPGNSPGPSPGPPASDPRTGRSRRRWAAVRRGRSRPPPRVPGHRPAPLPAGNSAPRRRSGTSTPRRQGQRRSRGRLPRPAPPSPGSVGRPPNRGRRSPGRGSTTAGALETVPGPALPRAATMWPPAAAMPSPARPGGRHSSGVDHGQVKDGLLAVLPDVAALALVACRFQPRRPVPGPVEGEIAAVAPAAVLAVQVAVAGRVPGAVGGRREPRGSAVQELEPQPLGPLVELWRLQVIALPAVHGCEQVRPGAGVVVFERGAPLLVHRGVDDRVPDRYFAGDPGSRPYQGE